jgi:hypothetical protein
MELSTMKVLYEVFDKNRDLIAQAVISLQNGYVSLDELERNHYFINSDLMYSENEYVLDHRGKVLDRDIAFWCKGNDECYHEDCAVTVYQGRGDSSSYSDYFASRNSDWIEFRGEYYDEYALEYYEIVYVRDIGEWGYQDNNYWHEGVYEWYSYPEGSNEEFTRGYHNGSYRTRLFDGKSKYRIGYEIEKEDRDVMRSIEICDFENETEDIWRKEGDGSLDDDSGYELISPTFEFNIDKIFKHIEGNSILVEHINAEVGHSCGGHIHLSEVGLSGEEMFEKIKGYTPLFYALYYGRVDKNYCKGKNNNDLKNENEKYQAIKIHHDRVEFRIISAVPNVKTLKWRSKLLMMILQHPTPSIIRAYYNVDTKFTKLLSQVYSDTKLVELKERFVKYTKQFEGLDLGDKNNNNNNK